MNQFVASESIKIFPCANRGNNYNVESRLNTEFNFVHLSSLGIKNSYNIEIVPISGAAWIRFVIHGYYVSVLASAINRGSDPVYASIKLVNKTLLSATGNLAEQKTEVLCDISTGKESDNLDYDNTFHGIQFTNEAPSDVSYSLQLLDGDGAIIAPMQTVEGSNLADGSVSEDKLATDAVTTDKIADNAITTDKIAADAVTTADIQDSAIETSKIKDLNITTDKLAANAITTDKIADNAITSAQLGDIVSSEEATANGIKVKLLQTDSKGAVNIGIESTKVTNAANTDVAAKVGHKVTLGENHKVSESEVTFDGSTDVSFAHAHGNLNDNGTVTDAANKAAVYDSAEKLTYADLTTANPIDPEDPSSLDLKTTFINAASQEANGKISLTRNRLPKTKLSIQGNESSTPASVELLDSYNDNVKTIKLEANAGFATESGAPKISVSQAEGQKGLTLTFDNIKGEPGINLAFICGTASSTAIKEITIPGFSLGANAAITVYFVNANTAANALQLRIIGTETVTKDLKINNRPTEKFIAGAYILSYDNTTETFYGTRLDNAPSWVPSDTETYQGHWVGCGINTDDELTGYLPGVIRYSDKMTTTTAGQALTDNVEQTCYFDNGQPKAGFKVFIQSTAPTEGMSTGDIWIRTKS